MSCGLDCRRALDLALLQLWHRLAAVAPIRHLAWEAPFAADAAQKKKDQKKNLTITINGYCLDLDSNTTKSIYG